MFFISFIVIFFSIQSSWAAETTKEDWIQLAKNYYWFAIEDSGNMDLFARAKHYLAKGVSDTEQYDSIDCGAVMEVKQMKEPDIMAGPESIDPLNWALPILRDPFLKNNYVPMSVFENNLDYFAIASDLCFQEDIAHDTMGGVFPMSRFLEGSLFQDARSYGIYEIIDNPAVMASTHATEKLIMDVERTLPDESNFAVVVTSYPQDTALENESYYIFNTSVRFYNYPATDQGGSLGDVASKLLGNQSWDERRGDWANQKNILQQIDASAVLWHHIEQQQTKEGDAFYIHHTRIIDHQNNDYVLKHMGFSLNKTQYFWPSILTLGGLYLLIVGFFIFLYNTRSDNRIIVKHRFLGWLLPILSLPLILVFRTTASNPFTGWYLFWYERASSQKLWSILHMQKGKTSPSKYIFHLLWIAPFFGFFAYLFLASILEPLRPSLENLWFVSFWWPMFTFSAIFVTPLLAYWPLKNRLGTLTNYDFASFFPVFSFLSLFGSSLHLISDSFFVFEGFELTIAIICFFYQIVVLTFFIHHHKFRLVALSGALLNIFAFVYLSKLHIVMMILTTIFSLFCLIFLNWSLKGNLSEKEWNQKIWAKQEILLWNDLLKQSTAQVQKNILEKSNILTFKHEPYVPTELFFYKLQQRLSKVYNKGCEHNIISLEQSDSDIYEFQSKAFGIRTSIGQYYDAIESEDSIATQNEQFVRNLNQRLEEFHDVNRSYFLYISNYDLIDSRIKDVLETYVTSINEKKEDPVIFLIYAEKLPKGSKESLFCIPRLEWNTIKEMSEHYLSPRIIDWVEQQAEKNKKKESEKNLQFLLEQILFLYWNHSHVLKHRTPGEGLPTDIIGEIITHDEQDQIQAEYKTNLAPVVYNQIFFLNFSNVDAQAIVLFEYLNIYDKIHSSSSLGPNQRICLAINSDTLLEDYIEQKQEETSINVSYGALQYTLKRILSIPQDVNLTQILKAFRKYKKRKNIKEICHRFSQILENDPKRLSPFTSIVMQSCIDIVNPPEEVKHIEFRKELLKRIIFYAKQQNERMVDSMIDIMLATLTSEEDKHVIFDAKGHKIIIQNLKISNPNRNQYLQQIYNLVNEYPNHSLEQRTWSFLLENIYTQFKEEGALKDSVEENNETTDKKKETLSPEKQLFESIMETYKKHNKEIAPYKLVKIRKHTPLFHEMNVLFHRKLIEIEDEKLSTSLREVLQNIRSRKTELEEQIKESLTEQKANLKKWDDLHSKISKSTTDDERAAFIKAIEIFDPSVAQDIKTNLNAIQNANSETKKKKVLEIFESKRTEFTQQSERQKQNLEKQKTALMTISIRIRNQLYRRDLSEKNIDLVLRIKELHELIQDREQYEKEAIDNDYALLRDFHSDQKNWLDAFTNGMNALRVSLEKIQQNPNDIFLQKKEKRNIIRAFQKCTPFLYQLREASLPPITKFIPANLIMVLFPNTSAEEWNRSKPRQFFMRSFHAICDSKADGGESLFSARDAHQICAYACLLYTENDVFSLNNAYLKSEIQSKIEIDLAKKPWFTNPLGCIAFLRTGSVSVTNYVQSNEATLKKEFLDFLSSLEA